MRSTSSSRSNARGQAKKWIDGWERLLSGPVDRLLAALMVEVLELNIA